MTTDHFTDDEIEQAIDGAGAGELITISKLREQLAAVQMGFEDIWNSHLDSIEDGSLTVISENDTVLVLADQTGHLWGDELKHQGIDEPEIGNAVIRAHHAAAKRLCDYSWATASPFVIAKPDGVNDGEQFMQAMLMWLMNDLEFSAGVALDWLMVEHHGLSQTDWASRAGKKQPSVSANVDKAKKRIRR